MATTETSGSGDITRSLELMWGSGERPTRGPKPGLTLERIVETAVRLADAEGIAAVSMRRLSTELGTGTMSLYRYVPGKAELLDLMLNHVQAPTPEDAEFTGTWRAALESYARGSLEQHRRHPWLLQVNQARPVLGPSAVEGLERVLSFIKPMGLRDVELMSVLIMVEGYVAGVARTQVQAAQAAEETKVTDEAFWDAQRPVLDRIMESGRYPLIAGLAEDTFGSEFDHFGFGLQRILDGLEVLVEQRARAS